jgi:prevent-host-death family protein
MLRVEMADAKGSLSDYARKALREPVLLTRRGRPVAALLAVSADEWEDLAVATHPGFQKLMERSRASCPTGGGITLEDAKRKHALTTRPVRRQSRRSGR